MILLTSNTTIRNALKIHYLQKEWLFTFTPDQRENLHDTYMIFAWYTYTHTHKKKITNCNYVYKFVFLYLQLLNLIPY